MAFEREGWSLEQVDDRGTRRWVYIVRDAERGQIQRGAVRIDPNVGVESDPVNAVGSECVGRMEAAAQECMDKIRECLGDRGPDA